MSSDARALVDELEFVWDQIKNNSPSSSNSSPARRGGVLSSSSYTTGQQARQFQQPLSGNDGPMRVLSPMSQDDEAERESEEQQQQRAGTYEGEEEPPEENKEKNPGRWRKTVEQALMRMTAEVAALREQIATGREYQGKRARSFGSWVAWLLWLAIRHCLVDLVILGVVLLWLRRRKDRRIEDLVRQVFRIGREYARRVLPER